MQQNSFIFSFIKRILILLWLPAGRSGKMRRKMLALPSISITIIWYILSLRRWIKDEINLLHATLIVLPVSCEYCDAHKSPSIKLSSKSFSSSIVWGGLIGRSRWWTGCFLSKVLDQSETYLEEPREIIHVHTGIFHILDHIQPWRFSIMSLDENSELFVEENMD